MCDPTRCDGTTPVTSQSQPSAPDRPRLRSRGRRLWEDEGGDTLTGANRVVLEEACRLVDRLDRLDAILNGRDRSWLSLEMGDDGEVQVVVDKVLSESRQQQLALKQLAAELRAAGGAGKPATGGGILDEIAARRKARLADASG
ncbi:hypothetical protein ABZ738_05555 [Micromonospora sp. NPDC047793]|uniref:hypothetical protein n=1 Tax=Micromonospora sp. NPDC047793 TaxID=3154342 RepID=UPI00340A12FD